MSIWSYITGSIHVNPLGDSQPQKRYVLETVLAHLPRVCGCEGDMDVYVNQKNGHSSSCTIDEFGQRSNLGDFELRSKHGVYVFRTQGAYIITVDGRLRGVCYEEAYKMFLKWMCRLSKRVLVYDMAVKITCFDREMLLTDCDVFLDMFEEPHYLFGEYGGDPNWCEFMLTERANNSQLPMLLEYKYYNNKENDEEIMRRVEFRNGGGG